LPATAASSAASVSPHDAACAPRLGLRRDDRRWERVFRSDQVVDAPNGVGDAATFDELDVYGQLWAGGFPSVGIAEFTPLLDLVADDHMAAVANRDCGDGKVVDLQVVVIPVRVEGARHIVGISDGHRAAAVDDCEMR